MGDESVADRARLTVLALEDRLHGLGRAAARPMRALRRRRIRAPDRLLIAPQDLRTADPTVAADIYAGYWLFDGKAVNARGRSPFEVEPPSPGWASALAGFGWLRHLRAADTALARANARALVGDWISGLGRPEPASIRPEVAARRLLSWLSQSPLILEGADAPFYRRFNRAVARQADALGAALDGGLGGVPRLTALLALCELGLCAEGLEGLQRRASRRLADELGRQILPDGGHISRDPRALLDLLLDLLPVRQAYAARGIAPPAPLLNAVDRMIPMVRCLRHGDGALALFNGMGPTRRDVIATLLAYDAGSAPLRDARYSGYQRLDAGATVLIVDAGPPPAVAFAAAAHAGTLAFEVSRAGQRLVVNCGNGPSAPPEARGTAAHSTLELNGRSSGRFVARGALRGHLYDGPRSVEVTRAVDREGAALHLSHDGYVRDFGYVHARLLWLAPDGERILGEDRLIAAEGRSPRPAPFALRFHLHPSLRAVVSRRGAAASIACPGGDRWSFEAGGLAVAVEGGVSYANAEGPRRAEQIVVRAAVPETASVRWTLALDRGPIPD